jgi:hypothetical protein
MQLAVKSVDLITDRDTGQKVNEAKPKASGGGGVRW